MYIYIYKYIIYIYYILNYVNLYAYLLSCHESTKKKKKKLEVELPHAGRESSGWGEDTDLAGSSRIRKPGVTDETV